MSFMSAAVVVMSYFWSSFVLWLHNLFIAPFVDFEMLWVLAPVYLGMVIAELFQEKHGTSMGNAVSNGIIVLWGGLDFLRMTVNSVLRNGFVWTDSFQLLIALLILAYGIFIVIAGIMAKEFIKRYARIREVSYCIIIFAPLYYSTVALTWSYLIGAILFFPIFYIVLELVNKVLPDPTAFTMDERDVADRVAAAQTISASTSVVPGAQEARRPGFIAPVLQSSQQPSWSQHVPQTQDRSQDTVQKQPPQ